MTEPGTEPYGRTDMFGCGCAEDPATGFTVEFCAQHQAGAHDDQDDDFEACDHDHDEDCYDYQGFFQCQHQHCFNCGGCRCPGYCDDYQTYNLRPSETGGADDGAEVTG